MSANTMLIRCLLKRKGGSNITMADGKVIAFRPDENDDHIAMVSDPAHIQRLLGIPEGYTIHTGPVEPVKADAAPVALKAPDAPAAKPAADKPEAAPVTEAKPAVAATTDLAAMASDDLRALFESEVGRKPHPNAKPETLIAQIEAIREENAKK